MTALLEFCQIWEDCAQCEHVAVKILRMKVASHDDCPSFQSSLIHSMSPQRGTGRIPGRTPESTGSHQTDTMCAGGCPGSFLLRIDLKPQVFKASRSHPASYAPESSPNRQERFREPGPAWPGHGAFGPQQPRRSHCLGLECGCHSTLGCVNAARRY